ncbi:MAG: DUF2202 domain-containing protein [Acidobacteria bacterium]|nr:DUF2202 domain-containing protein [Acidobacteriota bacterium]
MSTTTARTMTILAVLAMAAALPAAAQRGGGRGGCQRLATLPVGTLSQAETEGLRFIREEEKLARDVYTTLYADWQAREFLNIAGSEQRHMDAVKALLDRYAVADPVGANPVGVFADPRLQSLHDQLVARGRLSLVDALTVGATIEDLDLRDVAAELAEADDVDLDTVYQNLAKGSRNHLRAFVAALAAEGATYTPQYIGADTYATIIASARERGPVDAAGNPVAGRGTGRGGRGHGRSGGSGGGQGSGGGNGGVCDGTGPGGGTGSAGGNGGNGGNGRN